MCGGTEGCVLPFILHFMDFLRRTHRIEILNIIVNGHIIRRHFENRLLHLLLASKLTGKQCHFSSSGSAYNASEMILDLPRINRYDKCKGNTRILLKKVERLESLLFTM
jgi:hypothetical protein